MTEPTTEAGRRMVEDAWEATEDHWVTEDWVERILAIEQEKAADLARRIEELHEPTEGMGYLEGGGYGHMEPVCSVCGTADEYGVPWPCATVLLVREEAAG